MTSLSEASDTKDAGPSGMHARLRSLWRSSSNRIIGTISVILFLSVWQWAESSGTVDPIFASSPLRVLASYGELLQSGELATHIAASSRVFVTGFGVSVVVGIPIGFLMGWYRPMQSLLDPFVNFFNATPRIALLPLFLIWFGIGIVSKTAVVFMGAVFPILINSLGGMKNLDPAVIRAAKSFGANDAQVFRTIGLPGSVPFVLSGLRLGLALALTGTVVAELYAATAGIGYLIAIAGSTFQTDAMMVGITFVAGVGTVLTLGLLWIERRFQTWKLQS